MRTTDPRAEGWIIVVVDRADRLQVALLVGRGCRASGRFVLHTSPGPHTPARLQAELLRALGKHWDHAAQGGVTGGLEHLAVAWLHAEQATDVIVLRAHRIHGPALTWLLGLAVADGLHLWLVSPQRLPEIRGHTGGLAPVMLGPVDAITVLTRTHAPHDGDCDDLNLSPPAPGPAGTDTGGGLTWQAAHLLRRLYEIDTAAMAAAALLLGGPDPITLAAADIHVAADAGSITAAENQRIDVPEYAAALLRARSGRPLLPHSWGPMITAMYWATQLAYAAQHTGVRLDTGDPL